LVFISESMGPVGDIDDALSVDRCALRGGRCYVSAATVPLSPGFGGRPHA
jgi:hypothetical protein